jgi:uncharacterized protein (DUF2062 family)
MPEDLPQNEPRGDLLRWTAPLKKAYFRFLKIRGNPKEIALGFAWGLFVGMTPFMGLHTAIAVPLAALFKWNKFSAALAVWISNPLTAPVIYGITYYTGAKVLFIQNGYKLPTEFNIDALLYTLRSAPEIIGILSVGGVAVGLPLAVAGYYFAIKAITEYRESIQRKLEEKKANLSRKLKRAKPRKKSKKSVDRSGRLP